MWPLSVYHLAFAGEILRPPTKAHSWRLSHVKFRYDQLNVVISV